jgi:hypothetical protein
VSTEDIQAEISDIDTAAIAESLSCAECCETREDLIANLRAAHEAAKAASREIAKLLRAAESPEGED